MSEIGKTCLAAGIFTVPPACQVLAGFPIVIAFIGPVLSAARQGLVGARMVDRSRRT